MSPGQVIVGVWLPGPETVTWNVQLLVELPCVFRNATGSAIALAGIEMALAGIKFAIPADEVIDVMGEIGREMDVRYRETAGGGLAATPTGRRLAKERLYQIRRS